jgi:uncharacterized phage protein (TIGR01671 family)
MDVMTDRFKFRMWCKDKDDWIIDKYGDGSRMIYDPETMILWECMGGFQDDDYIFMQCTGLKDKNCVLIYEGDIIRAEWDAETKIYDVNWRELTWWAGDVDIIGEDWIEHIEIIGNIHENPELL